MSEEANKKRGRSDSPPPGENKPARRSRFEPANPPPSSVPSVASSSSVTSSIPSSGAGAGGVSAAAIAAAKAMEITRALQAKLGGGVGTLQQSFPPPPPPPAVSSEEEREKAIKDARARELQAQIAAQMASVSSLLVSCCLRFVFNLLISVTALHELYLVVLKQ